MPTQHILHPILLDPPQPLRRIHFRLPLRRDEPIALEPPRCHQYEHAERSIREPEPLRQRLAQTSNQQVNRLDIAGIHGADFGRQGAVAAGEREEVAGRRHVEEAAEGIVARNAALAVAQNVDGAHVEVLAVGGVQVAQEVGGVVDGDGARVVDAEGVEDVGEGETGVLHRLARVREGDVMHGQCGPVRAVLDVEEGDVVRDQGVEAIHGDEFFGQRVWHAVLVGFGAGDPAEDFARGDSPEHLVQLFAKDAPPVCVEGDVDCRVGEDCWCLRV